MDSGIQLFSLFAKIIAEKNLEERKNKMFYLEKTMEISAAHFLKLPYKSKCQNLHGHNWQVTIYCKTERLNDNGMVIDFTDIKEVVNTLDHTNLNKIMKQPTAENIAEYLYERISNCYKVTVVESEGNKITYAI